MTRPGKLVLSGPGKAGTEALTTLLWQRNRGKRTHSNILSMLENIQSLSMPETAKNQCAGIAIICERFAHLLLQTHTCMCTYPPPPHTHTHTHTHTHRGQGCGHWSLQNEQKLVKRSWHPARQRQQTNEQPEGSLEADENKHRIR